MEEKEKVCTVDQSEKLVEIGFKIKSRRSYIKFDDEYSVQNVTYCKANIYLYRKHGASLLPAPDVSELMVILPNKIEGARISTYSLILKKDSVNNWIGGYQDDFFGKTLIKVDWKNPARVLGDVLIFLIEGNHINPKTLTTN